MKRTKQTSYTVKIHHEGDSLWAEVPDLPGLFATGDTMDELGESLREAFGLYLEDDPDAGRFEWQTPPTNPEEDRLVLVCS
jgi:predicted RNase H-like HicB family nuclease